MTAVSVGVRNGFHAWQASLDGVHVCFAGRPVGADTSLEREAAFRALAPEGRKPAWLHQVHSATVLDDTVLNDTVLDDTGGCAGDGDALVRPSGRLALAVVTADCVPVLLAGGGEIAAVHAGWRGVAGRVVPATLRRMKAPATAWIGPAIGACCYEVGDDVAEQVLAACGRSDGVLHPGTRGRPHLDLRQAVEHQLAGLDVVLVGPCTRCSDVLWSYRRDGSAAGRNVAMIW